jgi:Protein of unknown function (DUF2637)
VTGRGTLYVLLSVVAGAAAMLSFAALRDLAELCGFTPALAWLLPVVVDAGAAAGSLVWLSRTTAAEARRFARRLALGLLGLSVAANALGHGLAAFVLLPPWWVVVILSGIAPAVLGAMVHLAVLVGRLPQRLTEPAPAEPDDAAAQEEWATPGPMFDAPAASPTWDPTAAAAGWSPPHWVSTDWPPTDWPPVDWKATAEQEIHSAQDKPAQDSVVPDPVVPDPGVQDPGVQDPGVPDGSDRAAALIAAGAGRRRLSRELGVTEYEARRLLEQARPATATDNDAPDRDDDTAAAELAADAPVTAQTTGARS